MFDAIIVCDGSGTTFNKSCGYIAKLFIKAADGYQVIPIIGGDTHGTNNFAELFPIVKALWVLRNYFIDGKMQVCIVSDSEWVIKTGIGIYSLDMAKPNSILWSGVNLAEVEWGYELFWVSIPRNSIQTHAHCDEVSKDIRLIFEELKEMLETNTTGETTETNLPAASTEMTVVPTAKPRKLTSTVKVSEARFVQVYNDPAISSQKQVGEVLGIDMKLVSVKAFLARKKGLLTRNLGKGPRNTNKSGAATTNA